jgi:tripartite-type tricarboxylate transporter receptor subunit TctC
MALSALPASAQGSPGWPSRPITAVVGFAAGGNSDAMARIAAQKLSERLGQNVVIDNRPGAGGALGAAFVARSAPDGNTLMFAASPTIGVVPRLQKVAYDSVNDFEPISSFGSGPYILAIRSEIPAKTVKQFVEYAKENSFTYGSGGVGTISHLTSALFLSRAKLRGVHVPFRGGGLTMTALIAGQLDMYFANASELIGHADDKRLTILGVTGETRLKRLPDVPTISEAYSEANMPATGLPSWNGFFAPRGTPKAIIEQLSKHMMGIAREPAVVEQLEQIGIVAEGSSAAEFTARIKGDLAIFDDAINAAGLPRAP